MNLKERYTRPTPKFFRTLRNIALAMTAIGGSILAAPVVLPTVLITIATYVTVAGTVATVVSQAVVKGEDDGDGTNSIEDLK